MSRFTRTLGVSLATATLLATAACGGDAGENATPVTDGADSLNVVVGFYPLQFVAERVAGTTAEITNLTQPGAEAHDLELTPRQIASLADADLVIYQKGFQPAVDAAVEQAQPARVLDVASVASFHTIDATGEHAHDHGDEAAHDEESPEAEAHADEPTTQEDADHAHAEGDADPHIWLSSENMTTITTATAEALAEARPDDQHAFRTNSAALTEELTALHDEFSAGLATCERREFVVSHAAFGYLADDYDLTQIPIRGLTPDNEPSPARIAEVQQLAREHGVTTIFYETLVSPAVAEAIAGDLNLKTDVLDPLEGLTPEAKGADYLEVMESNLTALKAANECR